MRRLLIEAEIARNGRMGASPNFTAPCVYVIFLGPSLRYPIKNGDDYIKGAPSINVEHFIVIIRQKLEK